MFRTRRLVVPLVGAMLLTGVSPFAAVADPAPPAVADAALPLAEVASEVVPADARAELPEALPEVVANERAFAVANLVEEIPVEVAGVDQLALAQSTLDRLDAEPVEGRRTEAIEAPLAFTTVYVELPEGVDEIALRVSPDGQRWEDWVELEGPDPLEGPDLDSEEYVPTRVSDPLQTDEARFVQVEVDAEVDVADLTVRFADVDGLNEGSVARLARHLTPRIRPAEASSVPNWVQPRSSWGARAPRGTPSIARNGVRQFVVHHTAGQNNLGDCNTTRIRSTIRGIQNWHMDGNGWSDIGYNFVVDPCGGIWEGRAGGANRAVVGAHAAGFNTGSSGVGVLGDFRYVTPNAATLRAFDRVIGWKAGIHDVNTTGRVTIGSTSYPTVVGHRDVGSTTCPASIQSHLPRIRSNAQDFSRRYRSAFTDTYGHAHEAAIERIAALGIASGYSDGRFRPNRAVTRAQVATFVSRTFKISPRSGSSFSDVPAGNPHAGAIEALVHRGIMNGYGNEFRPDEPLRRDHMAVVLSRAMALSNAPLHSLQFYDVINYRGQIGAIARANVAGGYGDGTFRPNNSVTRGQMATFMGNAIDAR